MTEIYNTGKLQILGAQYAHWSFESNQAIEEIFPEDGFRQYAGTGRWSYDLIIENITLKTFWRLQKELGKILKRKERIKFKIKPALGATTNFEMILDGFEIENGWTWLKERGTGKKQLHGLKLWGKKHIKPVVYVDRWTTGWLLVRDEVFYENEYGNFYERIESKKIYFLEKKPVIKCEKCYEPVGIIKEWYQGEFEKIYAGGIPQETKGWKNPEYCEILLSVIKEKK